MFTSAHGFSIDSGLTDFSMYEVELKKSMVHASNKVVALLDHTKINKNSIASYATTDLIDMVITDTEMSEGYKERLADLHVEIMTAISHKE